MADYIHTYELYHHGIKGMRWGVRRYRNKDGTLTTEGKRRASETDNVKNKRHLGIDSKGNISFTRDATTKKNVTKFAVKTAIFAAGMSASVYISKHPEIVANGARKANDILAKNGSKTVSSTVKDLNDSGLFSQSLNRNLTVEEAIARGLGEYITRR